MFYSTTFNLFGRKNSLILRSVKEKSVLMYGFGNRCKDGKYVLFLDYDNTPYNWISEEIGLLQEMFSLGTAYVFQTKNGYHVVFLEKYTLKQIISFLDVTSCDKNYKTVPLYYGRKIWVLRTSPKVDEELRFIKAHHPLLPNIEEKSLAHSMYLAKFYDVPLEDLPIQHLDGQENLTLAHYKIGSENN